MGKNFRLPLLGGAALLLAGITGYSAIGGNDWIIPAGITLTFFLFVLFFQSISYYKYKEKLSTPVRIDERSSFGETQHVQDDLPDPLDVGIDLPIL